MNLLHWVLIEENDMGDVIRATAWPWAYRIDQQYDTYEVFAKNTMRNPKENWMLLGLVLTLEKAKSIAEGHYQQIYDLVMKSKKDFMEGGK